MAERRMFSKRVISSAKFLKMPISTQALYFHLGLQADDDGIVEAYTVIKSTGTTEDDLKVLVAKGFVQVLNEDLVSYITDWRENNKIRADRKIDSVYKDLLLQMIPDAELLESKQRADVQKVVEVVEADENNQDLLDGQPIDNQWTSSGQLIDNQWTAQDRLGKDRLGEDRLGEDRLGEDRVNYQLIADLYNDTCVSFPRLKFLSDKRKKAIKARLKVYSIEDMKKAFQKVEESNFLKGANNRNWVANFDWLIKDSNLAKVLDGNYDNQGSIQGVKSDGPIRDDIKLYEDDLMRYAKETGIYDQMVKSEFEGFD